MNMIQKSPPTLLAGLCLSLTMLPACAIDSTGWKDKIWDKVQPKVPENPVRRVRFRETELSKKENTLKNHAWIVYGIAILFLFSSVVELYAISSYPVLPANTITPPNATHNRSLILNIILQKKTRLS